MLPSASMLLGASVTRPYCVSLRLLCVCTVSDLRPSCDHFASFARPSYVFGRAVGAEIIRRNADAAGRRRIKRPESENLTIFVGFLHLV